jgi:hypothetical protein
VALWEVPDRLTMVPPAVPFSCADRGHDRGSDAEEPSQRPLRRSPQSLRTLLRSGPPLGGSHAVFKTPWPGDPRVNIQNSNGQAKAYQVRQVLAAIEKKEAK